MKLYITASQHVEHKGGVDLENGIHRSLEEAQNAYSGLEWFYDNPGRLLCGDGTANVICYAFYGDNMTYFIFEYDLS